MNGFVKYLNSMNSAKSESKNALAESQLLEEYYSKIEVKRDISKKIIELLRSDEKEAIILTGHAGDGKTSILIQVLEEYGYFSEGRKPLQVEEEFKNLYYIKDMSELSVEEQQKLLLKFLECKKQGKSSIIVSNTGPIINTFKKVFSNEYSAEEMEKIILEGIDNVISEKIYINTKSSDYSFKIVNIANINNSYMIEKVLYKVLKIDLWKPCSSCDSCDKCPIFNNYKMVSENLDLVADKIGKLYYWLSEKGTRLTLRQMLAHITFSLTSNLECDRISDFADNENSLNKYSFVNGFFGEYPDNELRSSALNIKTIKELDMFNIDRTSFGTLDDELFIKENFSVFPKSIKERIKKVITASGIGIADDTEQARELRSEIRRYFILFSKHVSNGLEIDNAIMSEPFMCYYRAVTNSPEYNKVMMRRLNKVVFIALYRYFIGVYPMKDEENLYVTLRKDFNVIQNTQMLMARVPRNDIEVVREKIEKKVEPEKVQFKLVLKIGNKGSFDISSEFLEYMFKFYEGYVFTNLQPSFSYGISKLKTQILNEYREPDANGLTLILIQNNKVNKMKIDVDDEGLFVE